MDSKAAQFIQLALQKEVFAAHPVVLANGNSVDYGGGPGSTSALPSVAGMSQDRALAMLNANGFRTGPALPAWSTKAEGLVTATSPKAGTLLTPGSTVSLVVSKGEQPATVPTVKGMTVAAATSALTRARLVVAGTVERTSSRAAGTVLRIIDADSATIDPGTSLDAGTDVRLAVSKGPAAAPSTPTPTWTPQ